ncbi:MAG: cytochrome b5 domain-containing protein [Dehalococcoidia bacterium]|nr:cytochrome b5 domain-containing protein [Dehalococcoidia bacterium]
MATFDGKGGRPAYVAYQGQVYDVTASSLWAGGTHLDGHAAGKDMTGEIKNAPHGAEELSAMPLIGELRS